MNGENHSTNGAGGETIPPGMFDTEPGSGFDAHGEPETEQHQPNWAAVPPYFCVAIKILRAGGEPDKAAMAAAVDAFKATKIDVPQKYERDETTFFRKFLDHLNQYGKPPAVETAKSWPGGHWLTVEPPPEPIEYYHDECREMSHRAAWAAAQKGAQAQIGAGKPLADVLEWLGEKCFSISRSHIREKPENSIFDFMPVGELLAADDLVMDWLVDGLLARGCMSILSAWPKAGKSTLARNMAVAVATGSRFLGRETKPGRVLYAWMEGGKPGARHDWEKLKGLHNGTWWGNVRVHAGRAFDMAALESAVDNHKPDLVILDHFKLAASIENLSDYAEVSRKVGPFLDLARNTGIHLTLVHHNKKVGGEQGTEILGSTALAGLVDVALMVKANQKGQRVIYSINRHGEPLPETLLAFDAETTEITIGDTVKAAASKEVDAEVMDYLENQTEPVELDEIVEGVDSGKPAIRSALKRLQGRGEVERVGAGLKGDPYRFSVSGFSLNGEQETENGNLDPFAKPDGIPTTEELDAQL